MGVKTNASQVKKTMLKVKTKYVGAKPTLINRSAEVVKSEIRRSLIGRRSITGGGHVPLEAATVRAKRREGRALARTPLFATGIMSNVVITKRATAKSPSAKIEPPKSRDEIATFHQEGKGHNPTREWFGITKRAEARSRILAQQIIVPIFKNP